MNIDLKDKKLKFLILRGRQICGYGGLSRDYGIAFLMVKSIFVNNINEGIILTPYGSPAIYFFCA